MRLAVTVCKVFKGVKQLLCASLICVCPNTFSVLLRCQVCSLIVKYHNNVNYCYYHIILISK